MVIRYGLNAKDVRKLPYFRWCYPSKKGLMKGLTKGLTRNTRRVLYLLASLDVMKTSSADHYSLYLGHYAGFREQWSAERSARIGCVAGFGRRWIV